MSNSSKNHPGKVITMIAVGTLVTTIVLFVVRNCCGNPLISSTILGQFGDFYGGVFATIASIIAGVYLYLAYSNSKKDSDFQIINKLFDNIVQDINRLQFSINYDENWKELAPEKKRLYIGMDALYNFNLLHKTNPNSVMNHLNSILNSFENIILMANRVKYKYDDMKEITLKRIYYLYYSQILWSVWELEYPNTNRPNAVNGLLGILSKEHDDSKFIVDKYANLSIKTILFLSHNSRKLIEKKPNEIADLEKLKILI